MSEGWVVVANLVEEVNLLLLKEEACRDGVDRGVAPALVEEAARAVEVVEEVKVGGGAEEIEAADLKVGPLRTAR